MNLRKKARSAITPTKNNPRGFLEHLSLSSATPLKFFIKEIKNYEVFQSPRES